MFAEENNKDAAFRSLFILCKTNQFSAFVNSLFGVFVRTVSHFQRTHSQQAEKGKHSHEKRQCVLSVLCILK